MIEIGSEIYCEVFFKSFTGQQNRSGKTLQRDKRLCCEINNFINLGYNDEKNSLRYISQLKEVLRDKGLLTEI